MASLTGDSRLGPKLHGKKSLAAHGSILVQGENYESLC